MNPLGDADAIDALAAAYDRKAADLASIGDRVQHRAQTAQWACAKADRFRARMQERRHDAHRCAGELRDIARDLRRHAQLVRTTTADLRGIERKVRAWMGSAAALGADGAPIWQGWGGLRNLPGSLDTAWYDVAKQLRNRGINL